MGAIPSNTIKLPKYTSLNAMSIDGNKKAAIKGLLDTSRKIIDHPYNNDWWKAHITAFMTAHSKQITEEIRARNAGYVKFDGNHHH